MPRCRRRAPSLLPLLLAILVACLGTPALARPLVLAVTIDGVEQAEAVVAEQRDDGLWLEPGLDALVPWAGEGAVLLDHVPGLSYRLDAATQTLAIALPRRPRSRAPPADLTPNGWGAYLNYDAVATVIAGRAALDTALDMRGFAPNVLAYNGLILHAGRRLFDQPAIIRLDSGVTLPDPAHARRWTAGDFVGGGTSVTRPVRLGGIQITTDFGLRPDLVTFPVPDIAGQAAVLTVADVLADSAARQAQPPVAGAFNGGASPVTSGLNTVNIVSRDALGRESVRALSFYASRSLLSPGLSAISLEAGRVRTGYATRYDRYRGAAVAGTWRRGLSDALTAETHAEAARGLASASAGATWGVGSAGTAYLAASASSGRVLGKGRGAQITAGWERLARPVSFSLRYTRATAGFADLAARYGSGVRRETLAANIGFDLRRFGTLSAALLRLGPGRQIPLDAWGRRLALPAFGAGSRTTQRLEPLTLISGTAAVPVGRRMSLVANATRTFGQARATSASIGLLLLVGERTSAQAGMEMRGDTAAGRVALSRPAAVPGDLGYRVDLGGGWANRRAAQLERIGTRGRQQFGVERVNGTSAARVAAQGALVVLPDGAFRADRIDGSFALVDAQGQAGVPVTRENRPAGTTDRRGFLVVTGLLPYQANRIGLDVQAVDMDVRIGAAERIVRPREFAGTRIGFDMHPDAGLTIRLTDAQGRPLPAGARVVLNDGAPQPVGQDGEIYLDAPNHDNRLTATYGADRRCEARFPLPPAGHRRIAATVACVAPADQKVVRSVTP